MMPLAAWQIVEAGQQLAEAIASGRPYQTGLDPPPADPRVAHSPRAGAEAASTSKA